MSENIFNLLNNQKKIENNISEKEINIEKEQKSFLETNLRASSKFCNRYRIEGGSS